MQRIILATIMGALLSLSCSQADPAAAGARSAAPATPATPAAAGDKAGAPAGETSCDAVVAKLASYESAAGDPEKKLWQKMCADMPPEARTCIVASKTTAERDGCIK